MKRLFVVAALLGACVTQPSAQTVSYSRIDVLGPSPIVVWVEPGQAIVAPGEVDLVGTPLEQRSRIVFAAIDSARQYARAHNIQENGPPLIVNRLISAELWRFEVMLPVAATRTAPPAAGAVSLGTLPHGRAVAMDHRGSQDDLFASYDRLAQHAPRHVQLDELTWEQYLTIPGQTAPEDQRIRVFRAITPR